MAKMLCVEGMPLGHFTHLVNCPFIDPLVRGREMLVHKRLPVLFRDCSERVMTACSIKWSLFIKHHLLDKMFATAEKDVAHRAVMLNNAAQLAFDELTSVLK